MSRRLMRAREVRHEMGDWSRATLRRNIERGLFPPGFKWGTSHHRHWWSDVVEEAKKGGAEATDAT